MVQAFQEADPFYSQIEAKVYYKELGIAIYNDMKQITKKYGLLTRLKMLSDAHMPYRLAYHLIASGQARFDHIFYKRPIKDKAKDGEEVPTSWDLRISFFATYVPKFSSRNWKWPWMTTVLDFFFLNCF